MKEINYTHLPLIALRAFESAGRLGTMTAAAEELCVTPSAVSRQIRQLEKRLGVALFSGSKHKPVLSAQGAILLPILSSAMLQMLAGVNSVKAASQHIVNVSCLSTFAMRCLIPRLYRFSEQYPDIDIRLSTTSSDHIQQSNHDVVIGVSPRNVALGANQQILFAEKIGPVMSPSFLAANTTLCAEKGIMDVSDMKDIAMLQTRTRMSIWDEWCQQVEHVSPMTSAGIFEHYYFTLEAVLSGLGACIVPQHLARDDLNSQRLLAPLGFVESSYHYTVSAPSAPHQGANYFVRWLSEQSYT
jgi:LysR family transcriptional regulator, glycine cleavage system transcriptional activator